MIPSINYDFMNEHFTFIKPSLINNALPSAIDISDYNKNPFEKIDDTLPYIYIRVELSAFLEMWR